MNRRAAVERVREMHHYIEVDEYGLTLEAIADLLGYVRAAITDQERDDMLALARQMKIDDFVSRTLEFLPAHYWRAGIVLAPGWAAVLLREPDNDTADKSATSSSSTDLM
jgi:hypothetical protein